MFVSTRQQIRFDIQGCVADTQCSWVFEDCSNMTDDLQPIETSDSEASVCFCAADTLMTEQTIIVTIISQCVRVRGGNMCFLCVLFHHCVLWALLALRDVIIEDVKCVRTLMVRALPPIVSTWLEPLTSTSFPHVTLTSRNCRYVCVSHVCVHDAWKQLCQSGDVSYTQNIRIYTTPCVWRTQDTLCVCVLLWSYQIIDFWGFTKQTAD